MSQKGTHTDPAEFIGDLDAGVFAEKLGRALSDVALGTVENSKDGSVTVTFKVKRIALITSDGDPEFRFRMVQAEQEQEEMADDFADLIRQEMGGVMDVTIGRMAA